MQFSPALTLLVIQRVSLEERIVGNFIQDVRFAARTLLKSRGYAALALLACWIPATRATRVDPMIALRYE